MPRTTHQAQRHHYWNQSPAGSSVQKHHRRHLYGHENKKPVVEEKVAPEASLEMKTAPKSDTVY
tara:strand:+ start:67 stop:258 length:192 start_codon:yes stop_codon:yes gene_type:complete